MSDNESNKDEDGNEKPKRPLSAYNFFLKEERKNILHNMITDSTTSASETPPVSPVTSRRPMKKRRLMELTKKHGLDDGDPENSGINFERIGKLIGERWQEVKVKPELFAKYELLASNDHKRYMGEMKSYNDRKKNVLRSVMEKSFTSSDPSNSTIESELPSEAEHQSSSSGEPNGNTSSRAYPKEELPDNNTSTVHSLTSVQDVHQPELEHPASTKPSPALISLQSLLAADRFQYQALPIEYLAAQAGQIPINVEQLGAQIPFMRGHSPQTVPDNALNLAFLRQQEELALLRQETLYREFMQMEQARAYYAAPQGLQALFQQQLGALYSTPTLESLLAQQSAAGLQLAALQQAPQQAQLASLLSSRRQNPANQR